MSLPLWTRNGKLIINDDNKLVICDHCPCDNWEEYTAPFQVRAIGLTRQAFYHCPCKDESTVETYRTLGLTITTGIGPDDSTVTATTLYGDSYVGAPLVCDPSAQAPTNWTSVLTKAVADANVAKDSAAWTRVHLVYDDFEVNASTPDFTSTTNINATHYRAGVSQYNVGFLVKKSVFSSIERPVSAVRLFIEMIQSSVDCGHSTPDTARTMTVVLTPVNDYTDMSGLGILPWPFGDIPDAQTVDCQQPENPDDPKPDPEWKDVELKADEIIPCNYPAQGTIQLRITCTGIMF